MEVDSDWVEDLAVEEDDSQAEDSVRSHPLTFSFMSVLPKLDTINQSFHIPELLLGVNGTTYLNMGVVVLQDEDSLCNKLCTFTITQKEFMNQHW